MKQLLQKLFNGQNGKRNIIIALSIAVIILLGILVISYLSIENRPMDKDSQQVLQISIEEGSSTTDIANTLQENNLIRSVTSFKIISKLLGYDGKYLAGYYQLSPSMSALEMIKAIVEGDTINVAFTVVPGDTLEDVANNLATQGLCTKEEFYDEVKNGEFDYKWMKYLPSGNKRLEGVLFPETYMFPIGYSVHDIINSMLEQFDSSIDESYYSKAKDLGYSFYDVLIIASIIEKEASLEKERPLVSSVIYNRLEKGMYLQMCSTVSYLLDDGRVNLTDADIAIDSPYNTYKNFGLPPTPIAMSGASSIKAAFNPKNTDYLYFVLSEKLDGSSNFSSDYDKFLEDKNNYYEAYEKANGED